MSALGFLAIGFGILTVWSAFVRVNVFNILRTFVGAPVPDRSQPGPSGTYGSPTRTA